MASQFENDARREVEKYLGYQQWLKTRVAAVHARISAEDILIENGVRLKYGGQRHEQISCPFHGTDTRPSARYHPAEDGGPAGVWCFVCNERWDAITLWKKFRAFEGSFGSLLRSIENAYGIEVPEAPPEVFAEEMKEDTELQQLFQACERRLKGAKRAFQLEPFLVLSVLLEKVYFRVEKGTIKREETVTLLRRILDKIGEKERLCPDG